MQKSFGGDGELVVQAPEVMGSKWRRSMEEGDSKARAGVRTGPESLLHMATTLIATKIDDSPNRRWDGRPN